MGSNPELDSWRYFVFTIMSIARRGTAELANFRLDRFADPVKEHDELCSKRAGFQPAEIEASKVWLDTFPLLFVHVVLR
jgi:hypothetical protein